MTDLSPEYLASRFPTITLSECIRLRDDLRYLTVTERAKLGAQVAALLPSHQRDGRPVMVWVPAMVGVGASSLQRALRVQRLSPELFARMDGRTMTVAEADERVKRMEARSLDERRLDKYTVKVGAWKRVLTVNGAAQKMWDDHDAVVASIKVHQDRFAVVALANSLCRAIWQMQQVADVALARLSEEERARVDSFLMAAGCITMQGNEETQ